MITEIWKDIPGYEGLYQASNLGNILIVKRNNKKSLRKDKDGYFIVDLSKNNISKTFRAHRLILLTFLGESNLTVNHKNGIKTDNRFDNLEYLSNIQNLKHARKTGLTVDYGENSVNSKLSNTQVKNIIKLLKQGYKQKVIADSYNVSQSLVSAINKNKRWKHLNEENNI